MKKNIWYGYLGKYNWGDADDPFHYPASELLDCAKRRKLAEQIKHVNSGGNRVTDFTKWIGSLYRHPATGNTLAEGKETEREIFKLTKMYARKEIPDNPIWECIHTTSADDDKTAPFKISNLLVNSQPIWGIPDVVFRNIQTGEILIIEIKVTDKPIPSDGWPDLRAQLWAYGLIDDWRNAPTIHLAAEIWGKCPTDGLPSRRKILHWTGSNQEFDSDNRKLFEVYNGKTKIANPFST